MSRLPWNRVYESGGPPGVPDLTIAGARRTVSRGRLVPQMTLIRPIFRVAKSTAGDRRNLGNGVTVARRTLTPLV
jgi:hypothetical protein